MKALDPAAGELDPQRAERKRGQAGMERFFFFFGGGVAVEDSLLSIVGLDVDGFLGLWMSCMFFGFGSLADM